HRARPVLVESLARPRHARLRRRSSTCCPRSRCADGLGAAYAASRGCAEPGEGPVPLSLARRLRPLNEAFAKVLGVRLVRADVGVVRIDAEWIERFRYFDR